MITPPIMYRKTVKNEDEENDCESNWIEYVLCRPSLPMTEIAVELFAEAVPKNFLDDIDMYFAASVSRNVCMSPCSIILAMAYLERLRTRRPEYLQNISSSNLFLVSVLVASKFLYDEGEDEEVFNDEFALAANIETKDMNDLEMKFLSAIDWNVYMDPRQFDLLLTNLKHIVAGRKLKDRGWCTYAELGVLIEHLDYSKCWQLLQNLVIKVVVVSAIAYVTSTLVLVGTIISITNLQQTVKDLISDKNNLAKENPLSLCDVSNSLPSDDNISHVIEEFITNEIEPNIVSNNYNIVFVRQGFKRGFNDFATTQILNCGRSIYNEVDKMTNSDGDKVIEIISDMTNFKLNVTPYADHAAFR